MNQDADYSGIDSLAKVMGLAGKGILQELYLVPLEFGGAKTAENTVYVPVSRAQAKSVHDTEVVAPLIQQGLVSNYQAIPIYSGRSFVPSRIDIMAWGRREVNFEIIVWNDE